MVVGVNCVTSGVTGCVWRLAGRVDAEGRLSLLKNDVSMSSSTEFRYMLIWWYKRARSGIYGQKASA